MRRVEVPGAGAFLVADGVDAASIAAALREHRENRDPERSLKRDPKRWVTRVAVRVRVPGSSGGEAAVEAVVKERRLPLRWVLAHRLGVPSRFARIPRIAERIAAAGVDVPRVLAASSRVSGASDYAILEYVEGVSLAALLWRGPGRVRDRGEALDLIRAAGGWTRALHERGIWERDLNAGNAIVRRESGRAPRFALVDFDAVRFLPLPLSLRRRARNLAQLADLPAEFGAEAEAALLEGYLADGPPLRADRLAASTSAALAAIRRRRERRTGHPYAGGGPLGGRP